MAVTKAAAVTASSIRSRRWRVSTVSVRSEPTKRTSPSGWRTATTRNWGPPAAVDGTVRNATSWLGPPPGGLTVWNPVISAGTWA